MQARIRIKISKCLAGLLRDKYGNVIPCNWNQMLIDRYELLKSKLDV